MQTEQDDQKAKGDGQKDDADKKSETEEMEVTDWLHIFNILRGCFLCVRIHDKGMGPVHIYLKRSIRFLHFLSQTSEDGKQEKNHAPSAKKPKVKTKTVELPIENSLHWQLTNDLVNLFMENEVML